MPVSKFTPKATTTVKPEAKKPVKKLTWRDPDEAFKEHKLSVEIVGEQGLGKTADEDGHATFLFSSLAISLSPFSCLQTHGPDLP